MDPHTLLCLYAQRLKSPIHVGASLAKLVDLHERHQHEIAFENLSIRNGIPLSLNLNDLAQKILREGNGGFCYELNSLFNQLLRALHFRTRLISARVFTKGVSIGPEFDHMAICAEILGKKYLVDVGFGGASSTPILLDSAALHEDSGMYYRVRSWDQRFEIVEKSSNGVDFTGLYLFDRVPRTTEEFLPMFHYHQKSEGSIFTQKTICSKLTDTGRITLTDSSLIITKDEERQIMRTNDTRTFSVLLATHFGISTSPQQKTA